MLNCSVKAADVQSMPGVVTILMSDCGSEVGLPVDSVRKIVTYCF